MMNSPCRRSLSVAAFAAAFLPACTAPSHLDDDALLPPRVEEIDLSQLPEDFGVTGGPVFIHTTGDVTPAVVKDLEAAGLLPPAGHDGPVTFESPGLKHIVAGTISAGGVALIAAKRYVTMIEPSTDQDPIGY